MSIWARKFHFFQKLLLNLNFGQIWQKIPICITSVIIFVIFKIIISLYIFLKIEPKKFDCLFSMKSFVLNIKRLTFLYHGSMDLLLESSFSSAKSEIDPESSSLLRFRWSSGDPESVSEWNKLIQSQSRSSLNQQSSLARWWWTSRSHSKPDQAKSLLTWSKKNFLTLK